MRNDGLDIGKKNTIEKLGGRDRTGVPSESKHTRSTKGLSMIE